MIKWQGAEARVHLEEDFYGRKAIIKERFRKRYRHLQLDERLNRQRLVQEARCLARALRHGIRVPALYNVDQSRNILVMEYIEDSRSVKDHLRTCPKDAGQLAKLIGILIARLHNVDLVHGDLTTSNILVQGDELVLIDFGLAASSNVVEDKAVDLYVLQRAILSTHPDLPALFSDIATHYFPLANQGQAIRAKLDQVELRGRKRSMVG